MSNDEQAAFWRGRPGAVWAERQEKMDIELDSLGRLALDRLAAGPGERILDIGCGGGTTTLELARAVGPDGRVVGVDFSTPQVERARRRAEELGVANVTFLDADAAASVPGGPYDGAFSRFGVMFFADPVAAFANIRAAMAPGGRLAFVCWQGPEANAWFSLAVRAVAGLDGVELPAPPPPDAPGPMALADRGRIEAVLGGAGWTDVEIEGHHDELVTTPAELDDRVEFRVGSGPLGVALASAPDEVRQEALARARALFRRECGDPDPSTPEPSSPLTHGRGVWVVSARA